MIDAVASAPIFPVGCVAFAVLLVYITQLIIRRDGNDYRWRRPHLPARAPHHKPGHALGGPPATAPPEAGGVYRANARSELGRQRAARFRKQRAPGGRA